MGVHLPPLLLLPSSYSVMEWESSLKRREWVCWDDSVIISTEGSIRESLSIHDVQGDANRATLRIWIRNRVLKLRNRADTSWKKRGERNSFDTWPKTPLFTAIYTHAHARHNTRTFLWKEAFIFAWPFVCLLTGEKSTKEKKSFDQSLPPQREKK